jgi:ligand-binding sensor domain-containing protein/signal transduction histidine kinase
LVVGRFDADAHRESLPMLRSPPLAIAVVAAMSLPRVALGLAPDTPLGACTVDVWGARHGLPGTLVRAFSQTADGYLWIASYGGVGRYDGSRIVALAEPGPRTRIFDTQSLKIDDRGTLWLISSMGEPVCVHEAVARSCLPAAVRPSDVRLVDAHPDRDGTVWLATRTELLRYLPGPPPRTVRVPVPAGHPTLVHRDRGGRLWLGTESGLYRQEEGGGFALASTAGRSISGHVRAFFEGPKGRLWFALDRALVRVEGEEIHTVEPPAALPPVVQVIEDGDGNVWLGSPSGLTRFRDGRWVTFTTADGLPDDDVTALYEDREGSLWVGTRGGGVAQFTDRVVATRVGPPGLREEGGVESLCQDRSGAFWFGSQRGLVRWSGGRERAYSVRDGLPDDRVLAVAPGPGDELWVGTVRGLARVRDGQVDRPAAVTGAVAALHVGADGTVWMGQERRVLRLHEGRLEEVPRSGASQGNIRSIEPDQTGALWVAGTGGVARLEGGRLVPFTLPDEVAKMRALHRDREGRLWLTSGTDLVRLSPGPVRVFGADAGLGDRHLFQILDDDQGFLWLGTSRGLLRLSKGGLDDLAAGRRSHLDPLSLETTDRRRDVRAVNTRQPGAWRDGGGRLWFAADQGLLTIDPGHLRVNERPPTVRIDAAIADGRTLERGVRNELPPGPGNLEFRFSVVTLLEPRKSQHRYRLEGLDERWVEAGTQRVARYTRVPPAVYRFTVQGSNADGVWSEEGDGIELELHPHLYRSPLFYAACALGAVAALVLLWRRRVRRLRREYLAAFAERSRVARELHDTLLQGMSAVGLKLRGLQRRLGPDAAPLVRELGEIDGLITSSLRETRRFLGALRDSGGPGDLAVALASLGGRLAQGQDRPCTVRVEGAQVALPDDVKGDLFRIAEEAIRNALAHAQPSRVEVTLRYQPEAVTLTVVDDGCGFDASRAVGPAERHFGLLGMRERAARWGDLRLVSQPGGGTTIEVTARVAGPHG